MSEPFESFEHAGMTCELHPDHDAMSPAEWDTLGILAGWRNAADWQGIESATQTEQEAAERGCLVRYLSLFHGKTAVPFRLDDYGSNGQRIYESDEDNANGYIYATAASIEMTGVDPDKVRESLISELAEWNAYLSGEVIGYVVRDPAGGIVDSCWSFYPDKATLADPSGYEHVRQEAREAAENEADERERAANADIATREV